MARKYKNRQNSRYLKYVRRSIALLFTAVITIGALSGCGRGEGGKEAGQGDSAKGRYVEEDMELPVQEGEGGESCSVFAVGRRSGVPL